MLLWRINALSYNKTYLGLCVKLRIFFFFTYFNRIRIFSTDFSKVSDVKFHEMRRVRVELMHVDSQTGRYDEAHGHFLRLCERAY